MINAKVALPLLISSAAFLGGCNQSAPPTSQPKAQEDYELVVANQNDVVYKINKATGEVLMIKGKSCYLVKPGLTAEDLLKGLPQDTNIVQPAGLGQ